MRQKRVVYDSRAQKEYNKLPRQIQAKLNEYASELSLTGKLEFPQARKLTTDLYEMRIRSGGQWRGVYAYINNDLVIILLIFQKQTQRTPVNHLATAENRLRSYI